MVEFPITTIGVFCMAKTEAGREFLKSLGTEFYETRAASAFDAALAKSASDNNMGLKAGSSAAVAKCDSCGSVVHGKQSMASHKCSKCGGTIVLPGEPGADAAAARSHEEDEDGRHTLPGGQLLRSAPDDDLRKGGVPLPANKIKLVPAGTRPLPEDHSLRVTQALTGNVTEHSFRLSHADSGKALGLASVYAHDQHPVGAGHVMSSIHLPMMRRAEIARAVASANPHLTGVEWSDASPHAAISRAGMWDKDRMASSVGLVSVKKTTKKYTPEELHGRQMAKIDAALAARPVTKSLRATKQFEAVFLKSDLEKSKKKPKLGSGKRFKELEEKVGKEGADDPAAVAAAIGRKKYGAKKMGSMAAHGRKKASKAINFYLEKLEKSLGAQKFEDELRKSPRRKYTHPWEKYPGMPPEIVHGWKLLTGKTASGPDPAKSKSGITPEGKFHNWTDPDHPLHAAKIAFDWQQSYTKTDRYGDTKYNQHSAAHKQRMERLNSATSGVKRKAELREQALRDAQAHIERQGQHGAFHTPHPAIAVARAQHMENSVGRSHLTHEEVGHVSDAMRAHPLFAHLGEEVHHRLENFENFHEDAADLHHAQHGSYEGYHADATNIHPQLLAHMNSALGDSKNKAHAGTFEVVHAAHMATKAHPDIGAIQTDNRKKEP